MCLLKVMSAPYISERVASRDCLLPKHKKTARSFTGLQALALMKLSGREIPGSGYLVDDTNAATPWSMSLAY